MFLRCEIIPVMYSVDVYKCADNVFCIDFSHFSIIICQLLITGYRRATVCNKMPSDD